MLKKLLWLSLILILLSSFRLSPVAAKNNEGEDNTPEVDGIYNVPGRPDLKLRVFVHRGRPDNGSNSSLTCGLADPDSSSAVPGAGWHLPDGTWTYHLNLAKTPASVGGTNFVNLTAAAFNTWDATKVGQHVTSFTRGSDTTLTRKALDGQNIISWSKLGGGTLAVTYTWYYTANQQVAETDTLFNTRYPWSWSGNATCADPNSYDAQNILTHELGHTMGLNDVYSKEFVNNTMYGYGAKGEAKKDTLTTGDINGVNTLYY